MNRKEAEIIIEKIAALLDSGDASEEQDRSEVDGAPIINLPTSGLGADATWHFDGLVRKRDKSGYLWPVDGMHCSIFAYNEGICLSLHDLSNDLEKSPSERQPLYEICLSPAMLQSVLAFMRSIGADGLGTESSDDH